VGTGNSIMEFLNRVIKARREFKSPMAVFYIIVASMLILIDWS